LVKLHAAGRARAGWTPTGPGVESARVRENKPDGLPSDDNAEGEVLGYKPEKLDTTFQTMIDHLRSRYNLAFVSTNKKRDGATRKLKLDVDPAQQKSQGKLVVKARRSYISPRAAR